MGFLALRGSRGAVSSKNKLLQHQKVISIGPQAYIYSLNRHHDLWREIRASTVEFAKVAYLGEKRSEERTSRCRQGNLPIFAYDRCAYHQTKIDDDFVPAAWVMAQKLNASTEQHVVLCRGTTKTDTSYGGYLDAFYPLADTH